MDLNKFGLVPMQSNELRENSGGFLILLAIALELGAAAIEVGSLALAADMIVNPSRYTDAYKRGASGH
ncbi:MAG: hypothetical protein K2Q21_12080 [Chitinophagaceae bacterium]|nr:hypothetical protein [Chitinophagaceae bacterium]